MAVLTERRPLGDNAKAWALNAPAMVVIALLVAYPIAYSFWVSLQRDNLKRPRAKRFVGFDNYTALLSDHAFLSALKVSALFVLVVLGLTVVLALILALVLNERFRGRGLLLSLALLPWAMPGVVNGLMWRTIFDAKTGALNGLLTQLGLIDSYHAWLTSGTGAFLFTALAQVGTRCPSRSSFCSPDCRQSHRSCTTLPRSTARVRCSGSAR